MEIDFKGAVLAGILQCFQELRSPEVKIERLQCSDRSVVPHEEPRPQDSESSELSPVGMRVTYDMQDRPRQFPSIVDVVVNLRQRYVERRGLQVDRDNRERTNRDVYLNRQLLRLIYFLNKEDLRLSVLVTLLLSNREITSSISMEILHRTFLPNLRPAEDLAIKRLPKTIQDFHPFHPTKLLLLMNIL
ncbi:hypothetical protein J6590_080884 [Homalodisca vitripennis]|nr:hypothetical protein J6590_080884 [Homalodisca vitripennis]